jgi:pSer/pThr/pTyr-binding forkhead associated (FHA) protein
MADSDLDEGVPLQSFAEDARSLDVGTFTAKHGNGFLVHEGPLQPARRPTRPQPTVVLEKADGPSASSLQRPTPAPIMLRQLLVFPIRSTGRSPYPSMVTVGRTRNNDIVISDVAISKFHAFFKEEEGRVVLQDAGSRNGTRLDGEAVPDAKRGKPVEVKTGARVCFGEIEFGFVRGAQLHELASLAPRPR